MEENQAKQKVKDFWANTTITAGVVRERISGLSFEANKVRCHHDAVKMLDEAINLFIEDEDEKYICRKFIANSTQRLTDWFYLACFHIEERRREDAVAFFLSRVLRGEVLDRMPWSYPDSGTALELLRQSNAPDGVGNWQLTLKRIEERKQVNEGD